MVKIKSQERVADLLRCATTKVDRSQALIDFKSLEITNTGKNIYHWLEDTHKAVGYKP